MAMTVDANRPDLIALLAKLIAKRRASDIIYTDEAEKILIESKWALAAINNIFQGWESNKYSDVERDIRIEIILDALAVIAETSRVNRQ